MDPRLGEPPARSRQGVILLGHGARDPRWSEPFEKAAQSLRTQRPELTIRLAFLEAMAPDLMHAAEALIATGCERLLVVPVFLGQGGHVREDVPALVDTLRHRWPEIRVTLGRTAGEDDGVVDALASFCLAELRRTDP